MSDEYKTNQEAEKVAQDLVEGVDNPGGDPLDSEDNPWRKNDDGSGSCCTIL